VYFNPYSDNTNREYFEKQVRKDDRFEALLYCRYVPYLISDRVYEIVIKLKDGRIIGGEVRSSIYRFRRLTIIDNYRINLLRLDNDGDDSFGMDDGIYYNYGISNYLLEQVLHKPSEYFDQDLNIFIECYDEIKEFFGKIYNEGRIPGNEDDRGPDISKWGDEEELRKYTGYIIIDTTDKVKIYADYIGNKYDLERPRTIN
jgi:hypothetical protein